MEAVSESATLVLRVVLRRRQNDSSQAAEVVLVGDSRRASTHRHVVPGGALWSAARRRCTNRLRHLRRTVLPRLHARTRPPGSRRLVVRNVLAYGLEDQGDLEGAERLLRGILAAQEKMGGPGAPDTFAPRNNLAMLLMKRGHLADALAQFDLLATQVRARLGADHPFAAIFDSNRGDCLARMGRLEEARRVLEGSHARLEARFGAAHERTRTAAARLADVLQRLGLADKAAAMREAAQSREG